MQVDTKSGFTLKIWGYFRSFLVMYRNGLLVTFFLQQQD